MASFSNKPLPFDKSSKLVMEAENIDFRQKMDIIELLKEDPDFTRTGRARASGISPREVEMSPHEVAEDRERDLLKKKIDSVGGPEPFGIDLNVYFDPKWRNCPQSLIETLCDETHKLRQY